MKVEQLMEMAKEYEKIVIFVKNGELSIYELKEAIGLAMEQIDIVIDLTSKILNGEEVEEISAIQRVAIMAQIEEEKINFDYKEQKRTIVTLLNMVSKMDEEINEEIFMSFIMQMFDSMLPMLDANHKDSAKAIRKGIKKFKKLSKETV
jgi:hypothetical protein